MITETGNDRVGRMIKEFMADNGIDNSHVCMYEDGRTAISLAYLNERNDADYVFYKDYPKARLEVEWPVVNKDDIIMMGSYFVLNPVLRPKVKEFLDYASKQGALIYYDINFRSTHAAEAIKLRSTILENFEYASIVRGSTEDFMNMFKITDPEKAYKQEVAYHCKQMLCTDAEGDISLFSPSVTKKYQVNKIETVSTIGAGDNFNAGIVFGLMKEGISREGIASITEEQWNRIIAHGMAFATEVCQSLNNSISKEFANNYGRKD
jgi:fructokinase